MSGSMHQPVPEDWRLCKRALEDRALPFVRLQSLDIEETDCRHRKQKLLLVDGITEDLGGILASASIQTDRSGLFGKIDASPER